MVMLKYIDRLKNNININKTIFFFLKDYFTLTMTITGKNKYNFIISYARLCSCINNNN